MQSKNQLNKESTDEFEGAAGRGDHIYAFTKMADAYGNRSVLSCHRRHHRIAGGVVDSHPRAGFKAGYCKVSICDGDPDMGCLGDFCHT